MATSRFPPRPVAAAAAASAVTLTAEGQPVKRVQLLPIGAIRLRDGRGPYRLQKDEAAAVIAATKARAGRTDIMVDYDHQSFFGAKDGVGGQAPAAGWISPASLSVEPDGIWAEVQWTAAAAQKLAAREYRYLSPLFTYDSFTGRVLSILNAGLTNTPAIEELAAVATTQETIMDWSAILAALGLPEGATQEDVLAAIAAMREAAAAAATATATLATAAKELGLQEGADAAAVLAAARTACPDPAKYVPASALAELTAEIATLKAERIDRIVAAACRQGKVSPALKDWATAYATKDLAGFATWLAAAPVLASPGEVAAAATVTDGRVLSEEERKVAKLLGLSEEAYLKGKEV
ncbi:MAG: phage protease [Sphingomonadaceae bacterium]